MTDGALYISISSKAQLFCRLDEPGKQVRSAIKIKNTSKSHVAFKVCTSDYFVRQQYVPLMLCLFLNLCFSFKQLHLKAVSCVRQELFLALVRAS